MPPPDGYGIPQKHPPDPNGSPRSYFLWKTVRHYLSDIVFGANDGIITTFVVVSGVTGAALPPRIILIMGFANLLADGFSMAASNYLSKRSGAEEQAPVSSKEGVEHGASTFLAFVVAGSIPLIAYLTPIAPAYRLLTAVALTLVGLFLMGATRALVTPSSWWRSGLEMLLVGAIAAAVAFVIGAIVAMVFSAPLAAAFAFSPVPSLLARP